MLADGFLLVHKKYIRCFFRLLWMSLDGACHGYKTTIYVKGKGLRLQLKTRKGHLCIYLKLGYSHKIFLHLPVNCWAKIYGRRRTIRLYTLNYTLLRNLALKIKSFYPMGLYKVRGFFIEKEKFKIIEGKSRLGSGLAIMANNLKNKLLLNKIRRIKMKTKLSYELTSSLIENGLENGNFINNIKTK